MYTCAGTVDPKCSPLRGHYAGPFNVRYPYQPHPKIIMFNGIIYQFGEETIRLWQKPSHMSQINVNKCINAEKYIPFDMEWYGYRYVFGFYPKTPVIFLQIPTSSPNWNSHVFSHHPRWLPQRRGVHGVPKLWYKWGVLNSWGVLIIVSVINQP